jgi:hypothetical protein
MGIAPFVFMALVIRLNTCVYQAGSETADEAVEV